MSVRKRKWFSAVELKKAEEEGREPVHDREAWVCDYTDQHDKRRLKTFTKKKDADEFAASARVEVGRGEHVAESATITVSKAGELWITELSLHGINTSAKSEKCYPCVRYVLLPMSRVGHLNI